jgi:carotenoid cleavage dioxygenase
VLTDDLETVRFTDFDGGLPGGFTAHPKRHPGTGELHAAGYWWQRPGIVDYVVVGLDGSVVHHAAIPTPGNPMVHDCSITDTAMVIYDLPCTFDLQAGLEGWPFPYRWNPDHAARLGVLPLRGSADQVQWFQIDPCYVFHPINAYDVGTRVVIDVIRHPKVFATDLWGPNEGAPATWRYVLDRATGTATEQQLDDRPLEFPRIDERVVGRQHRYSWAVEISLAPDGDVLWPGTGLVRRDQASQTSTLRTFGPGRTVGEAVFVPRSPDAGADDGWYLAFVHDAATDRSELVVLDGQGWSDEPVAVVHLPARVPLGFHGSWVPSVAEEPPPPTTSTPTIPPTTTPTQPPAAAPAQPLSGNPTFTG